MAKRRLNRTKRSGKKRRATRKMRGGSRIPGSRLPGTASRRIIESSSLKAHVNSGGHCYSTEPICSQFGKKCMRDGKERLTGDKGGPGECQ